MPKPYRYLAIDEDGTPWGFDNPEWVKDVSTWQAVWDLQTGEVHANWEGAVPSDCQIKQFVMPEADSSDT